jgi:predicted nucleic acid-binding protein
MRAVLDASTALKWVLVEIDSDKAIRLRDDFRNSVHELIAPDSFSLECAHSLTKKQRQGLIPDAKALWDAILLDSPVYYAIHPLMERAVTISIQFRHNIHDFLYVALAEQEGCELLTADQKLINNLQRFFPFIIPLAALP